MRSVFCKGNRCSRSTMFLSNKKFKAFTPLKQAFARRRNKHFPRGELWCLVKLFWLELGHFHLYRAIATFIQALGTWRHGELRRNEGFRLFGHYLLQVLSTPFKLLKHTPHTVMGAGTLNAALTTCICPLHQLLAVKR